MYTNNKVIVINTTTKIDITCRVCGFVARDTKDLDSIEKDNGCAECVLHYKYLDTDKWKQGIYPDRADVRQKIILELGDL